MYLGVIAAFQLELTPHQSRTIARRDGCRIKESLGAEVMTAAGPIEEMQRVRLAMLQIDD